jgi:uracil phosphoribosyltransferase
MNRSFPNLHLVTHPLVQHKLTHVRDHTTSTKEFRELVAEISLLMAYEVTRELELDPVSVETPLETAQGHRLKGRKLVVVPVLRAGLGMLEGIQRLIPGVRVGHVGLYRDEATLQPIKYYLRLPDPAERDFIVVDPMLATGGSAVAALNAVKAHGVQRLSFMCLIAAPEGVRVVQAAHPDVPVYAAALDRELDQNGYIRPGLGDAGDRLFGTS